MFEKHTCWLTGSEFALSKPVNVFHREAEKPEYPDNLPKNVHMYARRSFRMPPTARSAELLISADDYYKLYINGEFVAQGPAPGYPQAYYVNRIDVLKYLRSGDNVLALDIYYQGLINRVWVSGDMRQGFICELRVNDKVILRSDERFRCLIPKCYHIEDTSGYQTRFTEHYDAREEPEGWKDSGYDDFMWQAMTVKTDADYSFVEQPTPVLETEVIEPVLLSSDENRSIYDFGHEIAACLLLEASGTSGKRIVIHAGEELNEDGSVRWQTRANCVNQDSFTVSGKLCSMETYDYLAFRYVEIIADDGVKLEKISARAQHYPADKKLCLLETCDEMLKNVFELTKYTLIYAVQEGFLDCPGREKGQYSGDLAVTSLSHLYVTGDVRLLRKALEDWMRSEFIAPALMAVFPASLNQEIADYSLLFPLVALRYYEHTLDREFLKSCYAACLKIIKVYGTYARADGLIENVTEAWNLVDWPKNLRDGYDFACDNPVAPGCHNVINALYIGAHKITEQIADILGENTDKQSPALVKAFDAAFRDADTGLYVDAEGSRHSALHSNIFPLFFNFIDNAHINTVADWLVSRGMNCGVYMAFFLLKALANAGRYDTVYSLLVSEGEHSWGNMLKEGATTLYEAWGKDQKWNTSLCHPWASAPIAVLVEDLLGITPAVVRGEAWTPHLPAAVRQLRLTVPAAGHTVIFERNESDSLTVKRQPL